MDTGVDFSLDLGSFGTLASSEGSNAPRPKLLDFFPEFTQELGKLKEELKVLQENFDVNRKTCTENGAKFELLMDRVVSVEYVACTNS